MSSQINPKEYIAEQMGIDIASDSLLINPLVMIDSYKDKIKNHWLAYDLNRNVSRYKWIGNDLPAGITSSLLERMLYYRFGVGAVLYKNKPLILPYFMTKGPNALGIPIKAKLIVFGGPYEGESKEVYFNEKEYNVFQYVNPKSKNFDLNELKDENTMIILNDFEPFGNSNFNMSRYALNIPFIEQIADTFSKLKSNLIISMQKFLISGVEPGQRKAISSQINFALKSNNPYVLLTTLKNLDITILGNDIALQTTELFNAIRQYEDMVKEHSSINTSTFGNFKKERNISSELDNDENSIDLSDDLQLTNRKLFAELYSLKFETKLECVSNQKDIESNENNEDGDNNDPKDDDTEI